MGFDAIEHHDIPDGEGQKIECRSQMVNQFGDVENITVAVTGFNNPAAAAVAILRFAQDFTGMAMSGQLGPDVQNTVAREMAMGLGLDEGNLCDEHADEALKYALPSPEDFERGLRSILGEDPPS